MSLFRVYHTRSPWCVRPTTLKAERAYRRWGAAEASLVVDASSPNAARVAVMSYLTAGAAPFLQRGEGRDAVPVMQAA